MRQAWSHTCLPSKVHLPKSARSRHKCATVRRCHGVRRRRHPQGYHASVDECPHGLGDPQTCTLCKRGPAKPRITRSPSTITKHRRFTCVVCGVEKAEDQFPTKTPRPPALPYRNGDEPCRECRVIVRVERKARGGTYKEATIRVREMRRGSASLLS